MLHVDKMYNLQNDLNAPPSTIKIKMNNNNNNNKVGKLFQHNC